MRLLHCVLALCAWAVGFTPVPANAVPVRVSWSFQSENFGGILFTIDSSEIGPPMALPTSGLQAFAQGFATTGHLVQVPSLPATFLFTDTDLATLAGDIVGGPIRFCDAEFGESGNCIDLVDLGSIYGAGLDGIELVGTGFGSSAGVTYAFEFVPEPTGVSLVAMGLLLITVIRRCSSTRAALECRSTDRYGDRRAHTSVEE